MNGNACSREIKRWIFLARLAVGLLVCVIVFADEPETPVPINQNVVSAGDLTASMSAKQVLQTEQNPIHSHK